MKMCISLLVLFCLAGCHSRTVHNPNEHRLSAQSEWAFACAQLGISSVADPPSAETVPAPMDESVGASPTNPPLASPPDADDSLPPDEASGGSRERVIRAYVPEWCAPAAEFRAWYSTVNPEFWGVVGFRIEIVPDDEIPDSITEVPAFEFNGKIVTGWNGIEGLQSQLSRNPLQLKGRRDREPKREHDVPMGAVNQSEILPLLIGDGLTLTRSGPDVTVPLGGKVALVIPSGMQVSASHSGDEMILSIEAGNPVIRLPWIGRLWPIKVEGMRLSGDTLTVELDGWKDYQIKVLP